MPDYARSLIAFQRRFPDEAAVGPGRNQEPGDDGVQGGCARTGARDCGA